MEKDANENFPVHDENWEIAEIAQRLKRAIENANGNKAVSERSGVPLSTLNGYIAGRDMKASVAARLAAACNVSVSWLLSGVGETIPAAAPSTDQYDLTHIDYYDVAASAGFGRCDQDAPKPEKVSVSRRFLTELGLSPNHTMIIQVSGDSMEPTMRTGDRIVVNTTPASTLDGVAVLVIHGNLLVKRLATTSEGIRIISDNDRYPSETAVFSRFRWGRSDGNDEIAVIGRVAYRIQAMS
ncbi:helix-turn-helix transcriptional regulator [Gluconacetobacter azotocaptans]|uniref:S24 family peptidase n=1 Tax=Gluconacetobacter azotocaptans TaxID=142834 RepID=UPI0019571217|nr:helix-turn-helix transcriptional regulator [Gluconacetobacter azotocaptans]MBM9400340.1 helix-turn-helix transcriptional regulator [Gluconacetobacter azotocaptans]